MSLAFYDIARLSSATIDPTDGLIVPGVGFTWADMYKRRHINILKTLSVTTPETKDAFL